MFLFGGITVGERGIEILKQYDMQFLNTQRARGAILCITENEKFLLKEYRGTIKRLEFEYEILKTVKEQGYHYVDNYIRNREGEILSRENDRDKYVLKEWYEGRECDVKNQNEILEAVHQLAVLHRILRNIEPQESWTMGSVKVPSLLKEYEKHNKELKRVRNYMRSKRKKTEFELRAINSYDLFYEQASRAFEGLKELMEQEPILSEKKLCHGEFSHHHIVFGNDYTAIIDFSKMHLEVQIADLYYFMRKIMEKNQWDLKLAKQMLDTYQTVLPLTYGEMQYLYYLFLYPEKYWKQINFYYNANKAWMPSRHMEKLCALEEQFEAKETFLNEIW